MNSDQAIKEQLKEALNLEEDPSIKTPDNWPAQFSLKPVFLVPDDNADLSDPKNEHKNPLILNVKNGDQEQSQSLWLLNDMLILLSAEQAAAIINQDIAGMDPSDNNVALYKDALHSVQTKAPAMKVEAQDINIPVMSDAAVAKIVLPQATPDIKEPDPSGPAVGSQAYYEALLEQAKENNAKLVEQGAKQGDEIRSKNEAEFTKNQAAKLSAGENNTPPKSGLSERLAEYYKTQGEKEAEIVSAQIEKAQQRAEEASKTPVNVPPEVKEAILAQEEKLNTLTKALQENITETFNKHAESLSPEKIMALGKDFEEKYGARMKDIMEDPSLSDQEKEKLAQEVIGEAKEDPMFQSYEAAFKAYSKEVYEVMEGTVDGLSNDAASPQSMKENLGVAPLPGGDIQSVQAKDGQVYIVVQTLDESGGVDFVLKTPEELLQIYNDAAENLDEIGEGGLKNLNDLKAFAQESKLDSYAPDYNLSNQKAWEMPDPARAAVQRFEGKMSEKAIEIGETHYQKVAPGYDH